MTTMTFSAPVGVWTGHTWAAVTQDMLAEGELRRWQMPEHGVSFSPGEAVFAYDEHGRRFDAEIVRGPVVTARGEWYEVAVEGNGQRNLPRASLAPKVCRCGAPSGHRSGGWCGRAACPKGADYEPPEVEDDGAPRRRPDLDEVAGGIVIEPDPHEEQAAADMRAYDADMAKARAEGAVFGNPWVPDPDAVVVAEQLANDATDRIGAQTEQLVKGLADRLEARTEQLEERLRRVEALLNVDEPLEVDGEPLEVSIAKADRFLHPFGKCTCGQLGTCDWCEYIRKVEDAADAYAPEGFEEALAEAMSRMWACDMHGAPLFTAAEAAEPLRKLRWPAVTVEPETLCKYCGQPEGATEHIMPMNSEGHHRFESRGPLARDGRPESGPWRMCAHGKHRPGKCPQCVPNRR